MKNKKKKKKIIFSSLIIILVVALGVGAYFYFGNSKKSDREVFVGAVDKELTQSYKQVKDVLELANTDIKTLSMGVKGKINVESPLLDENILEIINKLGIDANIAFDEEKQFATLDLDATYGGSKLVSGNFYLKDNYVYMYLNDLYDKWIRVESDDNENLFSTDTNLDFDLTNEELEILLKEAKNALIDALKDEYFTSTKEDDLNKITLEINNDNYKTIIKDVLAYLENSKDFNKVFNKLSDTKLSEISKEVNKGLKDAEKIDPIKISLYTNKKNEVKKVELIANVEEQNLKVVLEIIDDNNFNFTIAVNSVPYVTGSFKSKQEGTKTAMNIELSVVGMFNIKADLEFNFEVNGEVKEPNINNYIDADNLNDRDSERILEKLMENSAVQELMNAVNNLIGQETM